MRLTSAFYIAGALLPIAVQAGMYGQPVLNLDAKTFKTVMATEHAAMVAFVAPWCGHCKNLGPEFTAAAQSLTPLIPFYAVDCDDNVNKPLCAEYQIKGFPTIKAFPRAGKGAARDYNGERKKGALVDYAKTLVPDRVKKLRVDTVAEPVVQSFLDEKSELPHVLLIHPSAPSIPFLWKVLAHRLSGKAHLGYVRDTASHSILSSLDIYDPADTTRDATRVVAWPAGAQSRSGLSEYEGAMKFNALLEWLQDFLGGLTTGGNKGEKKQQTNKAPEPISKSDTSGADAAARRAKMDEAERRDRERRERAAAAAAKQDHSGAGDGASPVEDAPEAVPQERVEESPIPSSEGAGAPDPVPEQSPDGQDSSSDQAVQTDTGIVHEEL